MDSKRLALVGIVVLGGLAMMYNIFVKDAETFSGETTMRLLFFVVLVVACGYELWKRASRR